jgi:hypothetical protein
VYCRRNAVAGPKLRPLLEGRLQRSLRGVQVAEDTVPLTAGNAGRPEADSDPDARDRMEPSDQPLDARSMSSLRRYDRFRSYAGDSYAGGGSLLSLNSGEGGLKCTNPALKTCAAGAEALAR